MNEQYPDRINNHKRFYSRRKGLRNNPTREEALLWLQLKNSKLGYKFRRQHSIGPYILDFYCPQKRLAIELDGSSHMHRKEYDLEREKFLSNFGVTTMRFWNQEVRVAMGEILERIKNFLVQ